jgi:uncharacterized membrane protein
MRERRATADRLGAFSDAVIAVIITIMVLELHAPEAPSLAALLPLWPVALSYGVSYVFIAIIWLNHHHLMRFVDHPTPALIWVNFAHLFGISLVPFATDWVAATHLAAVPVAVYAGIFVFVNLAYLVFERQALAQADRRALPERSRRLARWRSIATVALFAGAIAVAAFAPRLGFALICCALIPYLRPELPDLRW